jgi:hypothetical protein
MNTSIKRLGLFLIIVVGLGHPIVLAQKSARNDSLRLRHVVTLGYSKYILGEGPVFGYEMQLTRKWSAALSGGIGSVGYITSGYYRSGSTIASLDFRWYPLLSRKRPLSGPFVAVHSGWSSNWVKLVDNGQVLNGYYHRRADVGCNLGFQWVIHQSMTFNGQVGMGPFFGKRSLSNSSSQIPKAEPEIEFGVNGLFSLGAGIAF